MVEGTEEVPPQSGAENASVSDDVASHGGEGRRAAGAPGPIGEDAEPGQTAVPAPEDDLGVPPNDKTRRPGD